MSATSSPDPILYMYKGVNFSGKFKPSGKTNISSHLLKELLEYLDRRYEFLSSNSLREFFALAPEPLSSCFAKMSAPIVSPVSKQSLSRVLAKSFISHCLCTELPAQITRKPLLLMMLELLELTQTDSTISLLVESTAAELLMTIDPYDNFLTPSGASVSHYIQRAHSCRPEYQMLSPETGYLVNVYVRKSNRGGYEAFPLRERCVPSANQPLYEEVPGWNGVFMHGSSPIEAACYAVSRLIALNAVVNQSC